VDPVPYRDPEDRKRYDRERRRLERAGARSAVPDISPRTRLRMASDVEAVLVRAVELATSDPDARDIEKARALAQIASVALRLVEAHNLGERLEALERILVPRLSA
jgi:hypothetical protein